MNPSDRAALRLAFAIGAASGMWWLVKSVTGAILTLALSFIIRPRVLFGVAMAASIAISYAVIASA